jgi:gliding motility-associated-like protein
VLTAELSDVTHGFGHHLRIKAIAAQGDYYSWSNQQDVTFEHPLFIPNVFTPNGDDINETFDIAHINLYSPNELIIYNRWGEEVDSSPNYNGDWKANGLPAGVYYHRLAVASKSEAYRGRVQVVK